MDYNIEKLIQYTLNLYNDGLSRLDISKTFGTSVKFVNELLRLGGITNRLINRRIDLNDNDKEILNGLLLGDGCLNNKRGKNNALFQTACIKEEYIKYLRDNLSILSDRKIYHYKNRGKSGIFMINSLSSVTLNELHSLWYKDNIKCIPSNLKLSPLCCLHWYIGDGTLSDDRRILLHTNGFLEKEVNLLIKLLNDIGIKSTKHKHNVPKIMGHGYRIYIGSKYFPKFLEYIGKCPVDSFKYKWI